MKSNTCNCLGYNIFTDKLENLSANYEEKTLISTINQYSFCIAEKDLAFKEALSHSDVLLPDGVGIVAAVKLLNKNAIKKITGSDLHIHMLETMNRSGGTVFYMGSCDNTLTQIRQRLAKEYPAVKAYFFSPPFKQEFSDADSEELVRRVNQIKPDVLFVGMTAPKQEKWSYFFKDKLDVKYICPIGAVFDFYAGTVHRPGKIWIAMGLEWLGRLLHEPRRLSKRYLFYGPVFILKLAQQKIYPQSPAITNELWDIAS